MKKRLIVIVAALIAVGAWRVLSRSGFTYAGTLEAVEVDLPARLASTLASVDVREGDAVKTGQTLARLSCEDVILAAELAGKDFARAEKLYKEGSMPLEAYDQKKNRADDSRMKVSWCTLVSPLDGTVLVRAHEPGEWVAPGTKVLTLADLRRPYAYVYVPQPMLARLTVGQNVAGTLPETKSEFKGTIEFIRPEAEFTPKNVQTREERTRLVFGVKVAFENPDGVLKPGMPIEVALPRE